MAGKAARNRERAAAYLQAHPAERVRYEQVAAAVKITNQDASLALSVLLRDDVLPGLRRPGRGTYQWDPPGYGAGNLAGAEGKGVTEPLSRARLLELCREYTRVERDCFTAWCALAGRHREPVSPDELAASQSPLHQAAGRLRAACLANPLAAYATRRDLLTRQAEGEIATAAAVHARREAEDRDKIRTAWNTARWDLVCQRDALSVGLGWPHRGEWVTVTAWRHDQDGQRVPIAGDGLYLHDNDVYEAGHIVWLPALSPCPRDGHLRLQWAAGPDDERRIGPADPAGDIGLRLRDAPHRHLPVPLMLWPGPADVGLPPAGRAAPPPDGALFQVADVPALLRQPTAPPRPRRVPVPAAETADTLF